MQKEPKECEAHQCLPIPTPRVNAGKGQDRRTAPCVGMIVDPPACATQRIVADNPSSKQTLSQ